MNISNKTVCPGTWAEFDSYNQEETELTCSLRETCLRYQLNRLNASHPMPQMAVPDSIKVKDIDPSCEHRLPWYKPVKPPEFKELPEHEVYDKDLL